MKIGLLTCDQVNEEFRDIQGDYPKMFQDFFPPGLHFEIYRVYDHHFPDSVHACDAYLATGSRFSVYDDIDWINRLKDFVSAIHAAGKVYLGVCFGHQLLAESLGGKVRKSDKGWCVGIHEYEILHRDSWMDPPQNRLNLLMMCQDQVVELPEDSTVLARSEQCAIGMFRVGERMLGIQAHPEFSRAYNETLMHNRIDRMGKSTVEQGLASLRQPLQSEVFMKWALNFFQLSK